MTQKKTIFSLILFFNFIFISLMFMTACTDENSTEENTTNIEIVVNSKIYDGKPIIVTASTSNNLEPQILFVKKDEINEEDIENLTKEQILCFASDSVPIDAGDYYAVAFLEDEQNGFCVTKKLFTISPKTLTLNWIEPENLVYDGTPKEVEAEILSGLVNNDECKISMVSSNNINAGEASYEAVLNNKNYTATNLTKSYIIQPKIVEVDWAISNLVYDGSQKIATANITNLEENDECEIFCELNSGDNINVSENGFTYKLTSLSNNNYKLPENKISPVYNIEKAEPQYEIPTNLTATYGQTLAEIELPNGFEFVNDLQTLVGNAGTQNFMVKFIPTNTQNFKVVENIEVKITVEKANHKTIIAKHKLSGENDWRESNTYSFGDLVVLGAECDDDLALNELTYEIVTKEDSTAEGIIENNTLTITKAGKLYLYAYIAESENYFKTSSQEIELNINKINAKLTLSDNFALTKTYDGNCFSNPTQNDYTITPNGAEILVEWYSGAEKLNSAPVNAGNYTLKLIFNGNDNYNSCIIEKSVQITKAEQIIEIQDLTKYYDGNAVNPVYTYLGDGAVTAEYKPKTDDDNAYTAQAPTAVGEYVVKITITEGTNHNQGTQTKEFSINPYTISYVLDGGINSANNPNTYILTDLPLTLYSATKNGFNFVGWFLDENFDNQITSIEENTSGNLTLYAKFIEIVRAKLTYSLNNDNNSYKVTGIENLNGQTEIIIPENYENLPVTKIGENAFFNNSTITSVQIGSNITVIESCAFANCTSLTFIEIPDNVTEIGICAFAFDDAGSLNSIVLGSGIETIGISAFDNSGLTKIYYNGSSSQYANITFGEDAIPETTTIFYLTSNNQNETDDGNWWYYEDGEIVEKVVN